MKAYSQAKELPFLELKGISSKTIENHYGKFYQGYVKKWQEIDDKLKNADKALANATYSEIRELKLEQGFAADAILLHEAYFNILGGDGAPKGKIVEAIAREFGSFEKWQEEFKALGIASRGWVILAYDYNDGKLRNYIADMHNQGGVWGAGPIIVLDVYEHAYFIDYGSDRKGYIEAFFQNLDWDVADKKFGKIAKK